jgi:carboxymethylenebutenolidase
MNGRDIEIVASDARRFGAFFAQPKRLPAPAVMVLHEILGVNDFIRSIVNRMADGGFIAIAPELFWRQEANVQLDSDSEADMVRARALRDNFNERLALEDCEATLDYLRTLPACTGKVAAMGYCLGGKLAYLMAARSTIDGAVAYYGTGIHRALEEASKLRAPLLLHIAGDDFLCLPDAQTQIIDRLAALKDTLRNEARVHVYEGVNHGFARTGKSPFSATATALANSRTDEFLRMYLKQSGAN